MLLVRTALTLAKRGLHVFPCKPHAKEPATPHGCKDATTDPEMIRRWWNDAPQSNVAIATGTASGVFALDVDGLGAEADLHKLEASHGALPPTVESITARGRHLFFRMPGIPIRNSASKIAPGIDTRADGGYVLAPPSIHPSGRAYAWSVDSAHAFADAPQWLLDRITDRTDGNGKVEPTPPSDWRDLMVLITNVETLLHYDELSFALKLADADALREELKDFQRSLSAAGRMTFQARTGKHDDLVLAISLACWLAKRPAPNYALCGVQVIHGE